MGEREDMTIAPQRETHSISTDEQAEALIKVARRKTRKRWFTYGLATIVVAVAVVLVAQQLRSAISAHHPKASTSDAASSAALCTASQLKFVDIGSPGRMAGSWNELFALENVSATSCSVSGYPRLSLVTAHGPFQNLRVATFKSDSFFGPIGIARTKALPIVTMKSGSGVASFWVHGTDEPVNGQPCHMATLVRLTIPGGRGSLQVPVSEDTTPFSWCGNGVDVLPLVPGVSGSMPARPFTSSFGHPLPARISTKLNEVGE